MKYLLRCVRDRAVGIGRMIVPPDTPPEQRYDYQKQFIKHQFMPGEKVLDIGSGGDPFPYATHLADLHIEPSRHRSSEFRTDGKPVTVCDIHDMPFEDKEFDYVVASHILEHVDNPAKACREIQRVGKAGYIESPAFMKDALFSWAKGMHRWYLVSAGRKLFFFEYTDRQLEGIRTRDWERLIFSTVYHPLQTTFNNNQDIFNTMFEWQGGFETITVWKDGGGYI